VENKIQRVTFPSGSAITAQYRFGKLDSEGKIVPCSVDGEKAVGVIQEKAADSNREVAVGIGGIMDVECGTNITAGARVSTDSQGRAVPVGSSDDNSLGVAVEGNAGGAGAIIGILWQPLGTA